MGWGDRRQRVLGGQLAFSTGPINSWAVPGEEEKPDCRKEGRGRREDAEV